jgi:hypothetical protein
MTKQEAFIEIEKYKYLINTPLLKNGDQKIISHIIIIPNDNSYWNNFITIFLYSLNNTIALNSCGYDKDDFIIILIHFSSQYVLEFIELSDYLKK